MVFFFSQTVITSAQEIDSPDEIVIVDEEVLSDGLDLVMNEDGIDYSVIFNDLGYVSVDGVFYSSDDWYLSSLEHAEKNYEGSFFDILKDKETLNIENPNTVLESDLACKLENDSVSTFNLGWGMTGSGCSVTTPTYGYNPMGSGYGSMDVYKAFSTAVSLVSWAAAFVGLDTYTVKTIITVIANKLYNDNLLPSADHMFEGRLFRDLTQTTHPAIYGAIRERRRMRLVPVKWTWAAGTSSWYFRDFWSVKPC